MAKLSATELKAILEAEEADALSAEQSATLSADRSRAMDYYLGDMTGDMPSLPDRSGAISTDVSDTVDGMLPHLMEIFAGGDRVIDMDPVGPEDELAAQQEADVCDHVLMHQNPGWMIIYTHLKDGLLQKNGIVKVDWEEKENDDRKTFQRLPDNAYAQLVADDDVEIVEHEEYPNIATGMIEHSVVIVRKSTRGKCVVTNVPPEEFGVSRRSKSIEDADYAFHRVFKTKAELLAMGYDPEQVESLGSDENYDTEEDIARDTVEDSDWAGRSNQNAANQPVEIKEHYVHLDLYDDGDVHLYRITTGGEQNILMKRDGEEDIEMVDEMPFATWTPVPMPHRFFGRSIADLVVDIQQIKTSLLRSLLDNAYLANNQRIEIAETHAGERTLDDLLSNRPGGVVRTRQPGGLNLVPNQEIGSFAFPLLEYQDMQREWRTGVTRQGQGIDADALQNQSATAVAKVYSASQARVLLVARIYAETGLKRLIYLIHSTLRKNGDRSTAIKLRNQWINVNPLAWAKRTDMRPVAGLGSGTKQQQLQHLGMILQVQREALMAPQSKLGDPTKIYHTLTKLIDGMGVGDVEQFFPNPATMPDPPPQQDPKMVEIQGKLQLQQQDAALKSKLEQEKFQMERQNELDRLSRQGEIEAMQAQADITTKQAESAAEIQREQARFEFQKQLEILKAWAKIQIDVANTAANAAEGEEGQAVNPQKILDMLKDIDMADPTSLQSMMDQVQGMMPAAREDRVNDALMQMPAAIQQLAEGQQALAAAMTQPKEVVRDEMGNVAGVRPVMAA